MGGSSREIGRVGNSSQESLRRGMGLSTPGSWDRQDAKCSLSDSSASSAIRKRLHGPMGTRRRGDRGNSWLDGMPCTEGRIGATGEKLSGWEGCRLAAEG